MSHRRIFPLLPALGVGLSTLLATQSIHAYEVYADDQRHLNLDILAVFGAFDSRKNYDGRPSGSSWREGFVKYGFSGDQRLGTVGSVYGAFNVVSSATWGDGDASGVTDGSERRTRPEEAYLGWRSGNLFQALGEDGVDISFGRQVVKLGTGFIINDDALNLGEPAGELNRGGAYWLAARTAFDRTAVVRLGGEEGWHGNLAWIKSDNRGQAETELAAATLEHTGKAGTLGFSWIHGLDVNDRYATDFQKQRDGMDIYSLRGEGDAGIENARFGFEYAWQDKRSGNEKAWFAEAGYTFAELPWAPALTYRYSRYSQAWDSMFSGFSSGYGTWFQGEVAANYSGPFNSNTGVHHVGLHASPRENLTLGALFFDFNTLNKRNTLDLDARELDLFVEWAVSDNLIISPLLGLYQPKKHEGNGGNQVGGNGTNVYSQLTVAVPF